MIRSLKELGSGNVVKNGHIAGIAVAVEGWSGYYPVHHEQGGNMDKNWCLRGFKSYLTRKILHLSSIMLCMTYVG
jgi:hypothetical protein